MDTYRIQWVFFFNFGAKRDWKYNPVSFLYFTDEVNDEDHKPGPPLKLLDYFTCVKL